MTRMPGLVLAVAALAAALGPPSAAEEAENDHARLEHRFVRITDAGLHPDVQRIQRDEAFGWVNYSSKIANISFDREVGAHLTCRSRGSFRLTGERLESGNIQARQFASLCSLAPGEYTYRVELHAGIGMGATSARVHEGTLVVE